MQTQEQTALLNKIHTKKQEYIINQQIIMQNIKQYFSEATFTLMKTEESINENYRNLMLSAFQQIQELTQEISNIRIQNIGINAAHNNNEGYLSHPKFRALQERVQKMVNEDIKFVINVQQNQLKQFLSSMACTAKINDLQLSNLYEPISSQKSGFKTNSKILEIPQSIFISPETKVINNSLDKHTTTYKKPALNVNLNSLKQSYEATIKKMEVKIESLMIRQSKLQQKLHDMEYRYKGKKNSALQSISLNSRSQDLGVVSLKVQRLEAENKILIEQISECSQKLLHSQSSIIASMNIPPQYPPTQKKKNQKIQLQQIKPKSLMNENEEIPLRNTLISTKLQNSNEQNHKNQLIQKQQYNLQDQERLPLQNQISQNYIQDLKQEVQKITDQKYKAEQKHKQLQQYVKTLHRQLEQNIDKKMECQDKIISLNNIQKQLQNESNERQKKIMSLQSANIQIQTELQQTLAKYNKLQLSSTKRQKQLEMKVNNQTIDLQQLQLQKVEAKEKIEFKEEQLRKMNDQIRMLRAQLVKSTEQNNILEKQMEKIKSQAKKSLKQKQKDVKKIKKQAKNQIKGEVTNEREKLLQQFNIKFGELLGRIDILRRQINQIRQVNDKKIKVFENRMEIFKTKTIYDLKDMLDKLQNIPKMKSSQLSQILSSYVQSQSTISLRSAQNKQLKDEIISLKKLIKTPNQNQTHGSTQQQIETQIQLLQKQLFKQKYEAQRKCYEATIEQVREEGQLVVSDKQKIIQQLTAQIEDLKKKLEHFIKTYSTEDPEGNSKNKQKENLKKELNKLSQKHNKLESLHNSVKSISQKQLQEINQLKDELKLKKEYIAGLKKQLHQKQLEKDTLNKTIDQLMDNNQKFKSYQKQAIIKNTMLAGLKSQVQQNRNIEEQIQSLKKKLEVQQRNSKAEIVAKQSCIRQMKITEEQLRNQLKNQKTMLQQNGESKDKIRKMKAQIQRKDQLLQYTKDKLEKSLKSVEQQLIESSKKCDKLEKSLESQTNKYQSLRGKSRKLEASVQLMRIVMVRVYNRVSENLFAIQPKDPKQQKIKQEKINKRKDNSGMATRAYTSNNTREQSTLNPTKYDFMNSPNKTNVQLEDDQKLYEAGLSILGIDYGDLMMIGESGNNATVNSYQTKNAALSAESPILRRDEIHIIQEDCYESDQNQYSEEINNKKTVAWSPPTHTANPNRLIQLLDSSEMDCDKIITQFEQLFMLREKSKKMKSNNHC